MATKKSTKAHRRADQVRSDLLWVLGKVGEVESDWKLFRSRDVPKLKATPGARRALDLISRRAETNCRHIVGQTLFGLFALDRGDLIAADHAAETCWRLIDFDLAADEVVDALLADQGKEVARG